MREIFALASTSKGEEIGSRNVPTQDGLTLTELQDVGREVGLEPERVAHAALAIERRQEILPRGTTLGMPTSVGRIVEFANAPTQREWELLVAEMAHTFGGLGKTGSHGGLRQWSNGEVHAFLEPTEAGYRLRLTSAKANATEVNAMGGIGIAFALFLVVLMVGSGKVGAELLIPTLFGIAGAGALVSNVIRLPRWADKREQQMEYIATRAKELMASPSDEENGSEDGA